MKTKSTNGRRLTFSLVLLCLIFPSRTFSQGNTNCAPLPEGIVGWWRAEGDARDSAGTNHGSAPFGVAYTSGEVGQAFVFNTASGRILVPDNVAFKLESLSIEGWIKILGDGTFILFRGDNRQGLDPYTLACWPSGHINFHIESLTDQVNLNTPVPYGTWQHVAATLESSSGEMKIYLNGSLAAQTNTSIRPFKDLDPSLEASIGIGNHGGTFHQYPFNGLIDEISLYSRALSAAEVQAIFAAGPGGKCVPAVAPTILAQPQSQSVDAGSVATFTVSAVGSPQLTYQWRKDGAVISGASSSVYSIADVQLDDAGVYSVVVSNVAGFVVSSNAVLAVIPVFHCVPAPSGLVGWWAGEGNADDSAGGNHGVISGNLTFTPGRVGGGFMFDGNTAAVTIPASSNLAVRSFTLEAWFLPTDVNIPRPIIEYSELAGQSSPVHMWYNWSEHGASPGALYGLVRNANGIGGLMVGSAGGLIAPNQWSHVAFTYDEPSSTGLLYFNGAKVGSNSAPTHIQVRTDVPVNLGFRPDASLEIGAGRRHVGKLDEVGIFSRVLSAEEIQAIYAAGEAGKCPLAPTILAQPQNQSVVAGSVATFTVSAVGSPPLSYQWNHGGTLIDWATNSTLLLSNVSTADAGLYSVLVSNMAGAVLSSNANLVVNPPPALVRVTDTAAQAGHFVAVPIVLLSSGSENALAFSLNFNPAFLSYSNVVVGSGAPDATLLVNDSQAASGRLGVALGLPAGATFGAGTQEVMLVGFNVAILTNDTVSSLTFGNVPIERQLADAAGGQLPATFSEGAITIVAAELEGDSSPRPSGDHVVNLSDWVLVGRFAAGLDFPTNEVEFQRADCAPRALLGDGAVTIIDWVQAGRYAAKLDPLTVAGGPTGGPGLNLSYAKDGSSRAVRICDALFLQDHTGTLSVTLYAQGDENALGFSLQFATNFLIFESASPGTDASGAAFNLNTRHADSGRLGFALALPTGLVFPAGTREVVTVTFRSNALAAGTSSLTLIDTPVVRQVSDAAASVLETSFLGGSVTVTPPPTLTITLIGQDIQLSWPIWATNFVLEGTEKLLAESSEWTNLPVSVVVTNKVNTVVLPLSDGTRYFRLRR